MAYVDATSLLGAAPEGRPGWFRNLRIGGKMATGFGLAMLILAIVGGISYLGSSKTAGYFGSYSSQASLAIDAISIERDMTEMMRDVETFTQTANPQGAANAQAREAEIQKEIADATALSNDDAERADLSSLSADLGKFIDGLRDVADMEQRREQIASGTLDVLGPKLTQNLEAVAKSAAQSGDADAAYVAATALSEALKARLYANLMLQRHETADAGAADATFKSLGDLAARLEAKSSSAAYRAQLTDALALLKQYEDAFHQGEALDQELASAVKDRIDAIGSAALQSAAELAGNAEEEESKVYVTAERVISLSELTTAALSLAGLLIAVALAWLIGRAISRPVVSLSSAMQHLAGGEKAIAIPSTAQKDELGDMARSVLVFKESMIEAERLRLEQEQAKIRAAEERRKAMLDLADKFEASVGGVVDAVNAAATELQATAESLAAATEETSRQSIAVASAAAEMDQNVQTVAAATEELTTSIGEIGGQIAESSRIVGAAVSQADDTNNKVRTLADAAQKIGEVVTLINEIAGQTNLLALNATIEAARAGEAGKGFAVVASEVKTLATQTANATDQIAGQVRAIQDATSVSAQAIGAITQTIGRVNEISTAIASAVEEQGAATQEISRNVQGASTATSEVSSNITGVTDAAQHTSAGASNVLAAAAELARNGSRLHQEVASFLQTVRSA
ncbi:MAG TPA: methyl-accepting chemotaxis protein [Alphaproteobacteria bacterium]|nr:methyl-accepting chemotaxis protein [Alphaproteobacteria bacterium]